MNHFTKSNFTRIESDDYQTIDKRCMLSLLQHYDLTKQSLIDPCADNGSGIINFLTGEGFNIVGSNDAFTTNYSDFDRIISNPPYSRPLVENLISHFISQLESGNIKGLSLLLRSYFDHAKTRADFFENCPFYSSQIKMRFRPVWFSDGDSTPIHNFVWHNWTIDHNGPPILLYSDGNFT